ncbi:hypothetical protein D3C85_672000 [compost metagenome]
MGRQPKAEKTQGRAVQHRMGKHQQGADKPLGQQPWQQVGAPATQRPHPLTAGQHHIVAAGDPPRLGAENERQLGPVGERHRQDHPAHATPHGKADQDQQQHMGQRQHGIDQQPHRQIASGVDERNTGRHHGQQTTAQRRADAQLQTGEGTLKGPQPEIPPHLVGPEPMRQRGGLLTSQQIHGHILSRQAPAVGGQQRQSEQGKAQTQH